MPPPPKKNINIVIQRKNGVTDTCNDYVSVIESLLLDNQIFHFSKFKEFPNDENVTKQKTLPKGRNGKYKKKIPSDHLLN